MAELCQSNTFTMALFQEAAETALGKLADKNDRVRRKALQFFCKVLESNPSGFNCFDRKELEKTRDKLRRVVESAAAKRRSASEPEEAPAAGEAPAADGVAGGAPEEAPEASGEAAAGDGGADEVAPEPPPPVAQTQDERDLEGLEQALQLEALLRSRFDSDVVAMLGSENVLDVEEAMKAIIFAHHYKLEGARAGRILNLVFDTREKVRDAALRSAESIYLDSDGCGSIGQVHATSRRLLDLVRGANLAELTSLEKVVENWQAKEKLPTALIAIFWDIVQGGCGAEDRSAAMQLLNMAAGTNNHLLVLQRQVLVEQAKQQANLLANGGPALDLAFARQVCVALRRCAPSAGSVEPKLAKSVKKAMETFLVCAPPHTQSSAWFAVAEPAIGCLFTYGENPEDLCTSILHKMSSGLYGEVACSATLARLLCCLGHVAVQTLAHIELCQDTLGTTKQQPQDAPPPPAKGKGKGKAATAPPPEPEMPSLSEADLEEEKEYLERLGPALLDPTALLGSWVSLVTAVCRDAERSFSAELRSCAVTTLCKFMCVSRDFCEENMQLLFSVMESERDVSIRANIAIALGDFAGLHNTVVERWRPQLFAQLSEAVQPAASVRKNVLMVLTHLVIGKKLLIRTQQDLSQQEDQEGGPSDDAAPKSGAAELALRLVDKDASIRSLAHLFFTEYAKHNPISNLLPDVVSTLARLVTADAALSPEDFREVLSVLIGHVKLDLKLAESVVGGLCRRFTLRDEPVYLRCIAFCVCKLNHTDKSLKKLLEQKKTFGNKLGDDEVLACFTGLIARVRRGAQQAADVKPVLDELDKFVTRMSKVCDDDEAGAVEADDGENVPPPEQAQEPKPAAPAAKGKGKASAAKASAAKASAPARESRRARA